MAGVNPFLAGLNCRCPNCGRGPLFSGYLRIRATCADCGFDLARADSGDGPAVFVVLICGAVSCFGLLFTEVSFHWPVWLELTLWIPAAVLLCLAALRWLRPRLLLRPPALWAELYPYRLNGNLV